jgi:hypothetical protein
MSAVLVRFEPKLSPWLLLAFRAGRHQGAREITPFWNTPLRHGAGGSRLEQRCGLAPLPERARFWPHGLRTAASTSVFNGPQVLEKRSARACPDERSSEFCHDYRIEILSPLQSIPRQ